jgi:hypothetical protein
MNCNDLRWPHLHRRPQLRMQNRRHYLVRKFPVMLRSWLAYECLDSGKHIRLSDVHHAQFNVVVIGPQHLVRSIQGREVMSQSQTRRSREDACSRAFDPSHSIPRQLDSIWSRRHVHARSPAIGHGRDIYEASWNKGLKWLLPLQACD